MKGTQPLLLIAIAAMLGVGSVLGGAFVHHSSAAEMDRVMIGAATSGTKNYVAVDLQGVSTREIGLGAWTIDVTYDPASVSLAGCLPFERSFCYPAYAPGIARVTGASASGLENDFVLATLVFRCNDSSSATTLGLDIDVWAYSTIPEDPQVEPELVDGSITCLAPAPTSAATVTPVAISLPSTGSGPPVPSTLLWLIAALAAFGLAAASGAITMRRRA